MKHAALVGVLLLSLGGATAVAQQQAIPDAPAPQPANPLGDFRDVQPGSGTTAAPPPGQKPPAAQEQPDTSGGSSSSVPANQSLVRDGSTAPAQADSAERISAQQAMSPDFVVRTNEVQVPITVRDKKGALVPALDVRQFRVYEDGTPQRITFWTSDPFPMSVAFVVDQSLPADVMNRVNESLAAVQGAFTASDSVAVFGYNNSPHMITTFTGAQGARLNVALSQAKSPGRDMGVVAPGGPMDNGITNNGMPVDPNTTPQHGLNMGWTITPKEYHPLNDAILAAAEELAKQPVGRRRIIYIISDGKELGSKASYKEVVRYLLTNQISLYGTLVGDSAVWGLGRMDRWHLPLIPTMRDNLLPKYSTATGGQLDSEVSENGMQMSFSKITQGIRGQYTLFYHSRSSVLASTFHSIEVRIEGVPNLEIIAPDGYYPAAHVGR